jgi:hypothetical protein
MVRRPPERNRTKKFLILENKSLTFEEEILILEKLAIELLQTARQLPPGTKRYDMLKEIGRFRVRIFALRKSSI